MIKEEFNLEKVFGEWISSIENKTTKKHYLRIVPQFFDLMFDKKLNIIKLSDLQKITPSRVRTKYIDYLKKTGIKETTIINYLNVMGSFISSLSTNNVCDIDYWNIITFAFSKELLERNIEKRNVLTKNDFEKLKNWFFNKHYSKRYGNLNERYAMVVELMWVTSMRIEEAFSIFNWNDIYWEEDDYGNTGWTIILQDKKARVIKKPISEEFYKKLCNIFYNNNNFDNNLVLNGVSKQTFTRQLKEYSDAHNVKFTSESIRLGLVKEIENDRTKAISLIESTIMDDELFELWSKEKIMTLLNEREDLKKSLLADYYQKRNRKIK